MAPCRKAGRGIDQHGPMSVAKPPPESALDEIARRQLADYDACAPGSQFADRQFSLTVDQAYAVQIRMARSRTARGEEIAGYKIGCVSRTIQRQLGIEHAVYGHIFRGEVRPSPARLEASRFCQPGVEGEIAVRLSKDLDGAEPLPGDLLPYVHELFPVIELHNYIFRGARPSAGEIIASNALHAGVVLPVDGRAVGPTQPCEIDIRVLVDGRVDDRAAVDPLESLREMVVLLAAYGIRPRAGDMLLTGSPLPLYRVEAGDHVTVECPGFVPLEASFEAG